MPKQDLSMVCVRFEDDDLEVLAKLVEAERLTRSDVIRRAVRAYAEKILPKPKKR